MGGWTVVPAGRVSSTLCPHPGAEVVPLARKVERLFVLLLDLLLRDLFRTEREGKGREGKGREGRGKERIR